MDLMSAITNSLANGAYRMMNLQRDQMLQHQKKISSGKQINSAADDAAGLGITKKFETQVRGLQQANKNVQDGMSMLQTAEGGLENQHSILQRIRMLAIQSANDTLTDDDRSFIQLEVNQLISELDRISTTTEFNTKKLLARDGNVNIELLTQLTGITAATYPSGSWLDEGIHEINVTNEKNVADITNNIIGENYNDTTPHFSPNDDKIAFGSTRNGIGFNIYTMAINGTDIKQITNNEFLSISDFEWSPDGDRFAVIGNMGAGLKLYTMNADGSNINEIPSQNLLRSVVWSPDGNKITYTKTPSDSIDYVDLNTMTITTINTSNNKAKEPHWNNTSDGFYYSTTVDIRYINIDGSGEMIIYDGPGSDQANDMSFAGNKIIFYNDNGYNIMNDDGSNLQQYSSNSIWQSELSNNEKMTANYAPTANGTRIFRTDIGLGTSQITPNIESVSFNFSISPYLESINTVIDEKFTFTLTADNDGADVWSVVGSISGAHSNMTSGIAYSTDDTGSGGGGLSFTLDTNARFAVGDSFTINTATKAATIDGGGRTTPINVNGNTTVYKDDESTIQAGYGATVNAGTDLIRVTGADYIFHIGANMNQTINAGVPRVMNAEQLNMSSASVASRSLAEDTISRCDYAINKVSKLRANVGAKINRLEHIYNFNGAALENQASAKSRIEDADIAKEMVEYTKRQILDKVSMSMLTQANVKQKNILNLFQ